ncbi:unnamed protein product [Heligmosomoides polygyrus]|uniref:Reverse transcriptase domain-containing protein n=1 Tax=Heligmosomoides polygyrus TaxID=6339 RepID=A0A183GA04_HELPZ|nr:unnamed protein product [Heligmosomoides polygyrus]
MTLQALFYNRRQEELCDFKLKDVVEKLNVDASDFQEWRRKMGLLARPLCPNCNDSMQIYQLAGLFTWVIVNGISRTLDEGQPYEQAGFRRGFSTIGQIHTITKLIEAPREYNLSLCLTFIDLKKVFDSVETEAVIEALPTQGVPTQYTRVLRGLHSGFTTKTSPFYVQRRRH